MTMDLILVIALIVVFLRWLQVETHRRWRWVMAAVVVVSGVFTIGHMVNVWAGVMRTLGNLYRVRQVGPRGKQCGEHSEQHHGR